MKSILKGIFIITLVLLFATACGEDNQGSNNNNNNNNNNNQPKIYEVIFDSNGGTSISKQNVLEGGVASKPANPIKNGYTFKGWYLDNQLYDFNTKITKSIILKAEYDKEKFKITLNCNGGAVSNSVILTTGNDFFNKLPTPTRSGYTFAGWYTDMTWANKVTSSTTVTSNTTFYAKWEQEGPPGISIQISKKEMKTTERQSLKAILSPGNTVETDVTWTSSDTKIATISKSGVVYAKKPGTVTISVKNKSGYTAKVDVKITKIKIALIGNSKTYRGSIKSGSVYHELVNIFANRGTEVEFTVISKGGSSLYQKANNEIKNMDFNKFWNKAYDVAVLQESTAFTSSSNINESKGLDDGVNLTIQKLKAKNPKITIYLRETYNRYSDINNWYSMQDKSVKNVATVSKKYKIKTIHDGTIFTKYVKTYDKTSKKLGDEYLEKTDSKKNHLAPKGAYLLAACIYRELTNRQAPNIKYYPQGVNKTEAQELLKIANEC